MQWFIRLQPFCHSSRLSVTYPLQYDVKVMVVFIVLVNGILENIRILNVSIWNYKQDYSFKQVLRISCELLRQRKEPHTGYHSKPEQFFTMLHNSSQKATRILSQGCFGILSSLAFHWHWALRLCDYHQKWQRNLGLKSVGVRNCCLVNQNFRKHGSPVISVIFGDNYKVSVPIGKRIPLLLNITFTSLIFVWQSNLIK